MHAYIPRVAPVIPACFFLLTARNFESAHSTFADAGSVKMLEEPWDGTGQSGECSFWTRFDPHNMKDASNPPTRVHREGGQPSTGLSTKGHNED